MNIRSQSDFLIPGLHTLSDLVRLLAVRATMQALLYPDLAHGNFLHRVSSFEVSFIAYACCSNLWQVDNFDTTRIFFFGTF